MTAFVARWALVAAELGGATAAAILGDVADAVILGVLGGIFATVNVIDGRARRRERGIPVTGIKVMPRRVARALGIWSAWDQLDCPHPTHRERSISGDERNHGYRQQCMDCGLLVR